MTGIPKDVADSLISAPDGFLVLDAATGVILEANRAMEPLTGRTCAELIGMKAWDLRPPAYRAEAEEAYGRVAMGESIRSFNLPFEQPDGGLVPVEFQAWLVERQEGNLVVSIVRDISQHQRLQGDLRQRVRHARALLDIVGSLEKAYDIPAVISAVFEVVRTQLGFDHCSLCRFPEGGTHCIRLGIRSTDEHINSLPDGAQFELASNELLLELAGGAPSQVIEDGRTDPRCTSPGTRNLDVRTTVRVATQLSDGDRIVLEFVSIREEGVRQMDEASMEFALGVVAHAGATIERIWLAAARDRFSSSIEGLLKATSPHTGRAFFDALVVGLGETLGVKLALVCRDDPKDSGRFQTLSAWSDGQLVDNFSYRSAGTPCQDVRCLGELMVQSDVQGEYPEDSELVEIGAESCFGARFENSDGEVIGHCVVLHSEPFPDAELVERTVKLFASRASIELERQLATERLERSVESQSVVNALLRVSLEETRIAEQLDASLGIILGSSFFNPDAFASICIYGPEGRFERASTIPAGGRGPRAEELRQTIIEGLFDPANLGVARGQLEDGLTVLGVPIRAGQTELGVLKLVGGRPIPEVDLRAFCVAVSHSLAGMIARDASRQALEASEERLRQSQKLEALGSLAGGIAHDFNNLLTAVLGNAELLLAGMPPAAPDRSLVEEIHRAGESAGRLTGQLLAFTRRQMLARSRLDLGSLIEDSARMLRRVVPEDIHLELDLCDERLDLLADPGQLQQVLMNLVVNARDAMPGGGTLTMSLRPWRHADARDHACLSVADNGAGMELETRLRIFEPFFTTKEAGKGTGLGLAVVYGIVSHHEGWIEVTSEPGQGARFDIYLPLCTSAEEGPVADGPASGSLRVLGSACRALIVEDDPAVRRVSRAMLESLDYEVVEAVNGLQALACLDESEDYDVLVLDIVMPGMSGIDVYHRVRARGMVQPVLFVTGHDATERLGELQDDRSIGLLRKPYTRVELGGKLAELLAGQST
ncbi:MAG: ATP-binding protein [Planctomycetota bacterium]|nr:ATP-binding protein [Planctomycetota bacterium]